jgi:hypothetical protein
MVNLTVWSGKRRVCFARRPARRARRLRNSPAAGDLEMTRKSFSRADATAEFLEALSGPLAIVKGLDAALASPNNSDAERVRLLSVRSRVLEGLPRDRRQAELVDEQDLWAAVSGTATAAVNFWVSFMQMRGATKDDALTGSDIARLICITRAVSWAETRHGANSLNCGDVDPMQMGNPKDTWWRELTGQTSAVDRFVGGPGAANYDADELAAAAVATPLPIPACPDVSTIDKSLGHNDAAFTQAMSYYWGVPYLLLRINHTIGKAPFYLCGDLAYDRLFNGAAAYNANPDVQVDYQQRLTDNLDQTQCLA